MQRLYRYTWSDYVKPVTLFTCSQQKTLVRFSCSSSSRVDLQQRSVNNGWRRPQAVVVCLSPQLTVWMLRGLKSNSASRKILNTVHFSIKLSWKSYSSYSISAGCSFSELCCRRIVFCLQTFVLWSLREGKASGCLTWRLGLFGRRWCNLHLSMSECSVWNLLHRSFSLGKNNAVKTEISSPCQIRVNLNMSDTLGFFRRHLLAFLAGHRTWYSQSILFEWFEKKTASSVGAAVFWFPSHSLERLISRPKCRCQPCSVPCSHPKQPFRSLVTEQ